MAILPVIVSFGGMNAAGRSSGCHGYKRMVCDVLPQNEMNNTWCDLANRMRLPLQHHLPNEALIQHIKEGTLIRRIDGFDPDHVPTHIKATLCGAHTFTIKKNKLPHPIPSHWQINSLDEHLVAVTVSTDETILLPSTKALSASSAGSLPHGFDPAALYHSTHHPRGLALSVYGASDALNALGMAWEEILAHISPDAVSVYAGSALSQVDEHSYVGLIAEPLRGNRVTSKMMPFALPEMPADFINSYVINSVGRTGTQIGACASFLYNLRQGILDIQTGKAKVAIVGNAEAPIVPSIIEGFAAMSALASDESLRMLDQSDTVNHRRACRPFSTNTGFTMAESAQFVILMEDQLAMRLGLSIYGAVPDVFIHADGNKKSIAKPGIGNYLTFAKAAALTKAIVGQAGLEKSVIFAHGTGTPQNRVTESHILNQVAQVHGISNWPIAAIKAYLGHSMGAAAGDQLVTALGIWQYGYVPGIPTIDHIADDVYCSNLNILFDHHFVGKRGEQCSAALINAKGFGGNNATGVLLSPHETLSILSKQYGNSWLPAYEKRNQQVRQAAAQQDEKACHGEEVVYYDFGTHVMEEAAVDITTSRVKLSGFKTDVPLPTSNPYGDA